LWIVAVITLSSFPAQYVKIFMEEAPKFGIEPRLAMSVAFKESRFKNGVCFRGSHGLMQIQLRSKRGRSCAATMGKAKKMRLYDPRTNIRRGLHLMRMWKRWWLKHHRYDGYHWLLHYNQGYGRCPKGKRKCSASERIPVRTGKRGGYADRVLKIYRQLKKRKNEPLSSVPGLLERGCRLVCYSISM